MTNDEIRRKILDFLYDHWDKSADQNCSLTVLRNQLKLDETAIARNLMYLGQIGLIEYNRPTSTSPGYARITASGIDFIEKKY
jgi:hypothetical protein